jgi:hypothetical protein
MADDSLSSERNIFTATHSVFLHQIDQGALPLTRRGFLPAYRMGIGKNQSYVPLSSFFTTFMSSLSIDSDGLGVRVADSLLRGHWFESPLEQFVWKTRAVNSILGNRYMIGKIPTWWENSDRGNRKTVGKNSAMVGNFPEWEKKSLPLHGSFSTAAPVLYAGNYLPLFSQCG